MARRQHAATQDSLKNSIFESLPCEHLYDPELGLPSISNRQSLCKEDSEVEDSARRKNITNQQEGDLVEALSFEKPQKDEK